MHKSSLYVGQDKVNVNEVNLCILRHREGNIGWRYANPYVLYCCYNCKSNEYSSDLKASLLPLLISTSHYDCEFMFSLSKQRKSYVLSVSFKRINTKKGGLEATNHEYAKEL